VLCSRASGNGFIITITANSDENIYYYYVGLLRDRQTCGGTVL